MTQQTREGRPGPNPQTAPIHGHSPQEGTSPAPQLTGPPVLQWARRYLHAAGGRVPQYGSPEWSALPDADPRKVAACVQAAEAWRTYNDPAEIAQRAQREIEGLRDAHLAAEADEAFWTPDVVDQVQRSANRPSLAELSDRRGEPERAHRARQHARRMAALGGTDHLTGGTAA